jgi:hypothetical protein
MLDFRKLLASYNQAAAEQLPFWSPPLLAAVKAVSAAP